MTACLSAGGIWPSVTKMRRSTWNSVIGSPFSSVPLEADAGLDARQRGDGGQGARQDGQHPERRDAGGEHAHRQNDHHGHEEPPEPAAPALWRLGTLFPSWFAGHRLLLYPRERDSPFDRRPDGSY